MICEQNLEYNASLLSDQQSGPMVSLATSVNFDERSASNFTTAAPCATFIRDVRLKHFKRKRKLPLRFRHSIGSPIAVSSSDDEDSNNEHFFGDDEVDRFLEESHNDKSTDKIKRPKIVQPISIKMLPNF